VGDCRLQRLDESDLYVVVLGRHRVAVQRVHSHDALSFPSYVSRSNVHDRTQFAIRGRLVGHGMSTAS